MGTTWRTRENTIDVYQIIVQCQRREMVLFCFLLHRYIVDIAEGGKIDSRPLKTGDEKCQAFGEMQVYSVFDNSE